MKKYYDLSPDYRELAKEIIDGKPRYKVASGMGLIDKNKEIVK